MKTNSTVMTIRIHGGGCCAYSRSSDNIERLVKGGGSEGKEGSDPRKSLLEEKREVGELHKRKVLIRKHASSKTQQQNDSLSR